MYFLHKYNKSQNYFNTFNNNAVKREHIQHVNKIFKQFHKAIKFTKIGTFSNSTNPLDSGMIHTFSYSDNQSDHI